MNPNVPVMIIVVFVSAPVRRDPPSSTFPAAPVIDTTAEPLPSNVVPLHAGLKRVG